MTNEELRAKAAEVGRAVEEVTGRPLPIRKGRVTDADLRERVAEMRGSRFRPLKLSGRWSANGHSPRG